MKESWGEGAVSCTSVGSSSAPVTFSVSTTSVASSSTSPPISTSSGPRVLEMRTSAIAEEETEVVGFQWPRVNVLNSNSREFVLGGITQDHGLRQGEKNERLEKHTEWKGKGRLSYDGGKNGGQESFRRKSLLIIEPHKPHGFWSSLVVPD